MKEKIRTSLYWFILLQPFMDLYWFYNPPLSTMMPFTIPTILRIIAVVVLVGMYFSQKQSWLQLKKQWWVIAYIIVLLLYSLVHLWHVKNFNAVDPTGYNYSTMGELFYLVRMAMPIAILYITKYVHITEKQFTITVQALVGIISTVIVVSNLFVKSLMSYGNELIKANIFSWFTNTKYSYFYLASKGFFNFANTTSAVMFMLIPLMAYIVFKNFNWQNVTLLAMQALAMLMLGTKVAAFGLVIGFISFLIIYLLHVFAIKNIKFNKKAFIAFMTIFIVAGAILPYGPAMRRGNFEAKVSQERSKKQSKKHARQQKKLNRQLATGLKKYPSGAKREAFLRNFIRKHADFYSLNGRFVSKSYSYKYDPEFWLNVMGLPVTTKMNNRYIETLMLNKVVANNHNKLDKFLGISYIRESNIFNLERDFISQKYSLGWIGMILFLGVYVLSLIYAIYKWLRYRANKTLLVSSLILSSGFLIVAGFYSGNVMDFLTANLILGFVLGYLLDQINKDKEKTKV